MVRRGHGQRASASLDGVPTHTTALDWLRDRGLTGCKEGCAEGECGACSVLVARPALDAAEATEWVAINACLVPVAALDGQEVVTAEGLGSPRRAAPGAARDGGARRLAVRVLHTGLRLQHGGRVLPGGSSAAVARRWRARPERIRPARAERQPVPLHRLPADPRRRLRAGRTRPPTIRSPHGATSRRRPMPRPYCSTTVGSSCAQRRSPRRCGGCGRTPTPPSSPDRTDWGVEVNLRGARASTGGRQSTGCPNCANCSVDRGCRSRSVPP